MKLIKKVNNISWSFKKNDVQYIQTELKKRTNKRNLKNELLKRIKKWT